MSYQLSQRQESILGFIEKFLDDYQIPPTVRDIQSGCNISSTSVVDYNLQILQKEGYLNRLPDVSRGIELLENAYGESKRSILKIPVLGHIAAGEPIPVNPIATWEADEFDNVDIPAFLINSKSNVYGLKVKGESMIDALVTDGDLVILEPTLHANNGDMVAAWLDKEEEATLKRFYLEGDMVRLQPENSSMKPIMVPASNVAVRGKVVGVIRSI
ncbi:MAG: repressor LexA [Chloroflexi bacterium]|nr:repressor LexA [Chloroflexota bacterium]|tara:strand:+ start:8884 stop:9528 length:645 start_codon:yes stop_codon:yes gene_type:complete